MQRQQEFTKQHQKQQPYQHQQQQYCGRGRNTQQQQPQFGANMSQHHQGWLWQTVAENVEQVNVKTFFDTGPIPTPNTNNYYSNLYDYDEDEEDKKLSTETAPTKSPHKQTH